MEVGLVGLPQVGKTALLAALAGQAAAAAGGGSMKPNVAIAPIPDPRLGTITQFIPTRKVVPATIQLVDIPGLQPGAGEAKSTANQFLSHVRQVHALAHVVRCFEDASVAHVKGSLDPRRDIDLIDLELSFADLAVVENAIDKAGRAARGGDRDAKARLAVLERAMPVLSEFRPLRTGGPWSEEERRILDGYGMITVKPVLYVANVGEEDLAGSSAHARAVVELAAERGGRAVCLCAKLEAELAEFDDAGRTEMLNSLGLAEPAIGPLARGLNDLLGLSVFYTAGEKEVRAWVIPQGATAPEAAGAIHSDIQRGFIRAETFSVKDLVRYRSEKAVKEAGRLRSEGKQYVMRDGDVVHFLFNV
ncbi:MAG TPA: redox-regulated ATPase YchF [Phycisphaerales bacterium]|nr:redox-regulated ATPase YchF [Phycisphaerales bacterium]HMP37835.1 redox-regulated ATPase YchF [Phycisphaerales bacterium]